MDKKNLFAEFPEITKSEWIKKATTDLKGANFEEKLVWKTEEGLQIMPFYTKEDLTELDYLKGYHNSTLNSEKAHLGSRAWLNRQIIPVKDLMQANKSALKALNEGADALELDLRNFEGIISFDLLLKEILFPYCDITFNLTDNHFTFFQQLETYLESRGFTPTDLHGSLKVTEASIEEQYDLIKNSAIYPDFRSLVIESSNTSLVVEKVGHLLADTVNTINNLLDKSAEAEEVFTKLELVYNVHNNYFFEIAGLRALRLLICAIAEEYGLSPHPNQFKIHAQTVVTVNEETQKHPEWNMISNTTQAMSAIIGGCDSLSILPHNQGIATIDDFSSRIARNVSNILKEESYFDKVADPAAGSYYIENLTHQIAEKSWEIFKANI